MSSLAAKQSLPRESRVDVMLTGGRVMSGFREQLFDAANRAGMTPNEFCLQAAAEKLASSGRTFSGLFHPGDLGASR